MEDAVTRAHAQQLVAAALYVGTRVVGDVLRRVLAQTNRITLRAEDVAHTAENAGRLQALGARVSRQALGVQPMAVVATPDRRGGFRVHLVVGPQRPALAAYELTDVQTAWRRALQREFRLPVARPTTTAITAREQDARRALAALRAAQTRLFEGPSRATREAFAAALNRAQMASDDLRLALHAVDPVRHDQPLHHDRLDLLVRLRGDEGLSLVERDGAVRDLLARAAALPDAQALRVTLRPAADQGAWRAHVSFNARNAPERGPQHLNPDSLRETVLLGATSVRPIVVRSGGSTAHVAVVALETLRRPLSLDPPATALEPPAALRVTDRDRSHR